MNGRTFYHFRHKAPVKLDIPLEMEEDMARIHAGYTYPDYQQLPGDPWWCDESMPDSKADVLARYRTHEYIEAVKRDSSMPKKGAKK